jgi:signal transduction histidine kinase
MISDSANSNFVRALFKSADGGILAGTNRGLFQFENGSWRELEDFSGKVIYAIAPDAGGQIAVASASGLFTLDGEKIFAGDVRAVQNFQGKTYAAIFGQGIVKIEGEAQNLIYPNNAPTALSADREKLWIGTGRDGAFIYNGKQISQVENTLGAAIRQITPERENVWIAAENGLYLFANGNLEPILKNQVVRSVLADGADIWAATAGGGLFHLKRDETFGWLISNINAEQGLPSASVFALLKLENKLLAGTNRGTVEYVPNRIAPLVAATRILSQKLYSEAEMRGGINLEYPQNSLLLEAAGLSSRTFPEQFQYGFLLKNENGEVIKKKISGDNQFLMDELAPGDYAAEVTVYNQDLLASEPLKFNFSVSPAPFPKTSAALGVLLAVAWIALVWAIVERIKITKTNRELTAARFDLANEAERERRRIARDLHDQTLADLRNLMMMSDKLPTDNADFRGEIESVSNEIRRICEDLSPSVLENVGLTAALEFLLSNSVANHVFTAPENTEETTNLPANVQMQIFRIAQEVLSNIDRHSAAKTVEMRISESAENGFTLEIEDDGKGFEPQNPKKKGRGLTNIKSRAALIEADVDWETRDGGTVFVLHKSI